MNEQIFLPEGDLLHTEHNQTMTATYAALAEAALSGMVLEGVAVYGGDHSAR